MQYRDEIDGLRAIAIVSVVMFHSGFAVFSGGYIGVDIFFVISGFLITRIVADELREGRFTFADFYARRARRILPAVFFMTVVVTAACILILLPSDLYKYGKMLVFTTVFGANFRLAAERGYFDEEMRENPLLHMWSLSVEEQFYLAWPLLLVLIFRTKRGSRLFVPALLVASFAASASLVHWMPRIAFYHLPSRGWELLMGAVLALGLLPRLSSFLLAQIMSLTGLALMLLPVLLYSRETPFPGFAALLPTLGCAFVIHATSAHRTAVSALLSRKPAVFIGKISYSLYLWHWPLISLPSYILLRELMPKEAGLAIALAVALAIFSWRFVERPFRKPRLEQAAKAGGGIAKSFALALNKRAYAAIALSVILIVCGTYMQGSDGMTWRLSPRALAASAQRHGYQLETFCNGYKRSKTDLYECNWGIRTIGEAQTVLWGDSHADHYLPAVTATFGSGTFFMTPSCPPVTLPDTAPSFTSSIRNCTVNNFQVLNSILSQRPGMVLIGAVWSRIAANSSDTAEFRTFIQRMTEELNRAGAKVLILGQAPAQAIRCEGLRLYLGMQYEHCGRIEKAFYERQNRPIVDALSAVVNRNAGFYSPADAFCDQVYCYASQDGRWLYADGHHLNTDGGRLMASTLGAAVAALNARSQSAQASPLVEKPHPDN